MQYYAAPMEGLTDRVWRQAQQKWFGPEGTAHRYYTPFLSPPENRVLIKKKMAELAPAANPGAPVIPQLLAKDGELAAWMIGELRALGYTEVNLNLGCPSGTVTAKGKGSGLLSRPVRYPCRTAVPRRSTELQKIGYFFKNLLTFRPGNI